MPNKFIPPQTTTTTRTAATPIDGEILYDTDEKKLYYGDGTTVGGKAIGSSTVSDDVLEYANYSSFPETGEAGKIYIDLATNKVYRWSGSTYIEISNSFSGDYADLTGKPTLGTAAALDVGTTGNSVVQLVNGKLPAVDGSLLTGIVGGGGGGDLPSQTGHTGKYLTTDGSTLTWDTISYTDLTDKPTLGSSAALDTGVNNGVCPLNASGKVDSGYLPSYVDDVLEYANYSSFPETGEVGKIYIDLATNKLYRWSGSAYVEITSDPLPSQSSHTGKILTTNGTVASWTETKTINGESIIGTGNIVVTGGSSSVSTYGSFFATTPTVKNVFLFTATRATTINELRGIKTASGTATVSIQIGGVNVTELSSLSITSTPQDFTATTANTVSVGARVTVNITAVSSAVDLEFTLGATLN